MFFIRLKEYNMDKKVIVSILTIIGILMLMGSVSAVNAELNMS